MTNGQFKRFGYYFWNNKIVNIVFIPKLCLKTPFEDYRTMPVDDLRDIFGNFPIMKANQALVDNHPFAVSWVSAEDDIVAKIKVVK